VAHFVRIEVWTEVSCGSGVRVAFFEPKDLAAAVLKQSLAGTEQLAITVSRLNPSIAELVHGRILRIVYSDTTLDTEWRLAEDTSQSGAADKGQVSWTAQALSLDLARAPYFAFDSAGRPTFDFSATQLTATQWLAYVVTACAAAPLPYTVAVGTVDFINTFDLTGDFATALEIVRAIQQPGRAPGDFAFRRNGATNYLLDVLASRGSTAGTVRAADGWCPSPAMKCRSSMKASWPSIFGRAPMPGCLMSATWASSPSPEKASMRRWNR